MGIVALTAVELPRIPVIGLDIGVAPAFAKNDRSAERSRSDRGRSDRARGPDRRQARSEDRVTERGRRVWNRPPQSDRSDDGGHHGLANRSRSSASAMRRASSTVPETAPLPARRPVVEDDGFRNHGDRVSTYVALAKTLGFGASTGAMQANFGTPFENNLVARDPDTGELLKDPDTGEFIIDATDEEIAAVKPGNGPKTDWETETRMDVNMDGVVDRTDLELALGGTPPPEDDQDDETDRLASLRPAREVEPLAN